MFSRASPVPIRAPPSISNSQAAVVTNFSAGQIALGVAKGTGANAQSVDTNTLWEPNPTDLGQAVLVVMCYTVVSGGTNATDDTVSMWLNPSSSTFNASEASVPAPPDLGPASFGLTNSVIRDFAVIHAVTASLHRIASRTCASVPLGRPSHHPPRPHYPSVTFPRRSVRPRCSPARMQATLC